MLFDFLKRKKKSSVTESPLSEKEIRWNKMWDLWANGEIESPYAELMEYHSEINNGGHSQYFSLITDNGDVESAISALSEILPQALTENIREAYQAHLILEQDDSDENAESTMRKCDGVFFENEHLITEILEAFSLNL